MIPVSVIVTTKNESQRIERCLSALKDFNEVIVVDSGSTDETAAIARARGVEVIDFQWNGQYPKKRQWCLDHVETRHDRVFFVDADEVVTPALVDAIKRLDWHAAGYFVRGRYIWRGRALNYGLKNNKLCLFDRRKFEFPVVDDLDCPGMGEMEGHYQPVFKAGSESARIGQLKSELDHYAADSDDEWQARHRRYAQWEAGMNARDAWPADPVAWRQYLKKAFRGARTLRPLMAFIWCYIVKAGVLDGRAGLNFALKRAAYYRMINACGRGSDPRRSSLASSRRKFF